MRGIAINIYTPIVDSCGPKGILKSRGAYLISFLRQSTV